MKTAETYAELAEGLLEAADRVDRDDFRRTAAVAAQVYATLAVAAAQADALAWGREQALRVEAAINEVLALPR